MTFSLRLLNLVVGLCSGAIALPRDLFELGFDSLAMLKSFAHLKWTQLILILTTELQYDLWDLPVNVEL